MKNRLILWIEQYLFEPNWFQKFISFLLLPLSLIYTIIVSIKRFQKTPKDYGIPIISIGNLTVGGSSKTPFILSLLKHFDNSCVILRGYKRESSGMIVVSLNGNIKSNIKDAGDEAMLYAPHTTVIVSEDRTKAIKEAIKLGIKQIFLDDGFNKTNIKKYDILLHNKKSPTNIFTLPSGCYKEPKYFAKYADLNLTEYKDYTKQTILQKPTKNMILVTGISKPSRLNEYLPTDIKQKIYFPDHYNFKKEEIEKLIHKYKATSILCTTKDYTKLKDFDIDISLLELNIKIDDEVIEMIRKYIEEVSYSLNS